MLGKLLFAGRIICNAVVGALAGALPPVIWLVIEKRKPGGFRDGLGGLAWLAALEWASLLGALVGGTVGASGKGVRLAGVRNLLMVPLGACAGAVLGGLAGFVVVGIEGEESVALTLLIGAAGIVVGMLVSGTRSEGR
jgi:hypothetical protein